MAQQTGSISFEATNAVHLSAEGRYESLSDDLHDNYYTKSEFTVAPDKILSTVKEQSKQSARPNLSPYFSHPLTDVYDADENPDGYWAENRTDFWTNLTDGWGHVERVNSGSSGAWCHFYVSPVPNGLKPDTEYTFLVEWRNAVISGTGPQIAPTTVFASQPDCFVGAAYSPRITDGSEGSAAITVTTIADLSQAVVFSRGYISMSAGTSMSMDVRISLYEGEYSGPYKPYVDQSLITRVSTAETAIEQNAENILLRATKTEAQQMAQPNLAPITAAPLDSVYNATTNPNGYWKTTPANWFTKLEDGWVHVERDNTEGTGAANTTTWRPRPAEGIVAGGVYTILTEIRNNHSTVSTVGSYDIYLQQQANNQFWGNVEQVVPGSPDDGTSTTTTVSLGKCGESYVLRSYRLADAEHLSGDPSELFRYNFRLPKGCKFDFDIRQSVYEGIYDGPYKPYSGTQLYASQAQLKVANDAITSKVSTTDYNGQTIASLINQSADTVKIQAQHVEIDGTTTFTSGTTLADYVEGKAQDAADSVVVGGRNLLLWSGEGETYADHIHKDRKWGMANTYCTVTVDGNTFNGVRSSSGITNRTGGLRLSCVTATGAWAYSYPGESTDFGVDMAAGDTFTYSVDAKTSGNRIALIPQYYNGSSVWTETGSVEFTPPDDDWHRYECTFTLPANFVCFTALVVACEMVSGTTVSAKNYKLERGNRPTDWTPAPDDIEASAVKRTQRIWYRATASGAPSKLTTWLATSGTGYGNWSLSVPKLTSGTTKYLFLYTAVQTQTVAQEAAGTECSCSDVLLDENTTVIDGGSIITNSIDANKLTVYDATIGKIKADAIDVSAIKIGDLDGASTVVSNAANGKSAYDRHTAYRGTCSTAAGTAAKVVACTGFALATGATVEVYCSTANTADVPTLNVNSTGAKAIWINGAVASASNPCNWLAGDTVTFTYDGSEFRASLPVEGYVTEGTGGGLMVHRKSDATTGVKITDSVEILQNGTSVAEYGATARIGEATKAHIEQTSNQLSFFASDGVTNAITMTTTANAANGVVTFPGGAGIISANDGSTLEDDSYISLDSSMSGYANVTIAAHSSAEETWILVRPDRVILQHIASEGHIEGAPLSVGELSLATPLADTYIASVSASKLTGTIADANLPTKDSAGTAGTSDATSGATLAVPYITTDAYGRVIAKGTHTHTIGSLAASAVTSGTFNAARIPNLNASKITAGTLNSARLPTVPVNKGGTGQTGVTTVTDVASFIAAASGVTISSVRVTVWGKLVHAYVVAAPNEAKTSSWVVGTVVDAYRPNAVVTGKPYYTGVDSARIMTDGTMQITACGAHEVGVSFTYLLA